MNVKKLIYELESLQKPDAEVLMYGEKIDHLRTSFDPGENTVELFTPEEVADDVEALETEVDKGQQILPDFN